MSGSASHNGTNDSEFVGRGTHYNSEKPLVQSHVRKESVVPLRLAIDDCFVPCILSIVNRQRS
jgi:hypothetical protein